MSFLDELNDFFITGDTFYPDNKKRLNRIKELESDCNVYVFKIREEALENQKLMNELSTTIELIYGEAPLPETISSVVPKYDEDSPFESMISIYAQLFTMPTLQIPWKIVHAVIHEESVEDCFKDIGIALGITITAYAGSILFCGLPVSFFVAGPINGAKRRSDLRKGIKNAKQYRKLIYQTYYVNSELNAHLNKLICAVGALKPIPSIPEDLVESLVKKEFQEYKEKMNSQGSLEQFVERGLNQMDGARGSWTEED